MSQHPRQHRTRAGAAAALALAVTLPACNRNEPAAPPMTPTPAASAASAASAPQAAASGPLIAPVAASAPTDAQRQAGAQLASQGGPSGVAACASCHGASGEGNPAGGFPRIAGQSYAYLLHELQSYADDSRKNPVMQPIAKAMSADQRAAAAAHYASLAPAGAASGAAMPAAPAASGNAARGQQLALVGDESRLVQGCANCHGPDGRGSGVGYPFLAGQHALYLTNALAEWRDGSRANDPSGQMPIIAKALADTDAQAVAAYYSQLAPAPMARDAAMTAAAPASGAASAVVSGPRQPASGSQGLQGTGTEQGAPLTGGAQGPGGGGGGSGSGSTGSPTGAATITPSASASAASR
jgi:cytochrome c553